jgi:hypothetical protein
MILKVKQLCSVTVGALLAFGVCGSALAGPPVAITVKNLDSTTAATYQIITANESSTNVNATPKPATSIPALSQDTYSVQSTISPLANYASLRYKLGSKTCVFYTAYTLTYVNGIQTPQWSKSATPSGGATCTATTTATNIADHSWAVTFTIK